MEAFVIVEVAPHRVALPARDVEQVLRMVTLTPSPRASARLDGVLELHGELIPVVSLRDWLGLASRPPVPEAHLVVLRFDGRRIALHVDRMVDLAVVEADAVLAIEWRGPGIAAAAVRLPSGVAVVPRLDALTA